MAASMLMNGDTKKSVTSGDGGGGGSSARAADAAALRNLFNPDGSLTPQTQAGLDAYKALLGKGDITPPTGLTPEEALANLDKDLGTLKNYASTLEGEGLTPEETLAADANAAGSTGGARAASYDGEGGGLSFGGSGGRAGPVDRSGLGGTTIMGSLQMFDDETGRPLTLWQRATRKYQGMPDGKRAYILAKMEFIRSQALRRQKLELATKELSHKNLAQKTKTEPPAAKRAPASSSSPKPVNFVREKH